MNPRECGADPRTVCPTCSGASTRLGRDEAGETTERCQEGGEGRSRFEERRGQRQLSPTQ